MIQATHEHLKINGQIGDTMTNQDHEQLLAKIQVAQDRLIGIIRFDNLPKFVKAYGLLYDVVQTSDVINLHHLRHALKVCTHLVELGTIQEIGIYFFLHYTLVTNALLPKANSELSPEATNKLLLEAVHRDYGVTLHKIAEINLSIFRSFETFVSWNKIFPPLPVEGSSTKKKTWEKKTAERRARAFLALSTIPEIAIAKLVDRMYLLELADDLQLPRDMQIFLANDSLEVHATVADFLGIWAIKSRIEDLAFKRINNTGYKAIAKDLEEKLEVRKQRIDRAKRLLGDEVASYGINAEIVGRPKHIYSIMRKMTDLNLPISEVNDIQGIRVIIADTEIPQDIMVEASQKAKEQASQKAKEGGTKAKVEETYQQVMEEALRESKEKAIQETIENCFVVLSLLHQLWSPVQGLYESNQLFRDWISNPKPNGYQSIHTTVMFEGRKLEVQIRSASMHDWAENGLAAHWIYKATGNSLSMQQKYMKYAKQISEFKETLQLEKLT